MRQAYDYWQDQPDSFRCRRPREDRRKIQARSANLLAVVFLCIANQPGWARSPAGIYLTQSRHRLPRPDEESPDSVTSRNATDSRAPGSVTDRLLSQIGRWKCPRKHPLSQATQKLSESAGGDLAPKPTMKALPPICSRERGVRPDFCLATDRTPCHQLNALPPSKHLVTNLQAAISYQNLLRKPCHRFVVGKEGSDPTYALPPTEHLATDRMPCLRSSTLSPPLSCIAMAKV